MSLASQLLKHLCIANVQDIPWTQTIISRLPNHKPYYKPLTASSKPLIPMDFNVSHQAGLVSLICCAGIPAEVGTDVVCVNEKPESKTLGERGFFDWVDIHADVFHPSEVTYLKLSADNLNLPEQLEPSGYARDAIARCQYRTQTVSWKTQDDETLSLDANTIIDAKMRRFYALWCVREAYIKMTGDALLAEWLRELEFRNLKIPRPNPAAADEDLTPGEVVTEFEIYVAGKRIEDVRMELRAYGRSYMVASAVRLQPVARVEEVMFSGYEKLDLEKDIMDQAYSKE
jgi:4'-phosphopantetheinyl transferase